MSKELSPFSFILTLVLLITSILPSQASANSNLSLLWEKEFNSYFYNEIATTSTNGSLISTYDISDGSNYQSVYSYDFMKLDAKGDIVQLEKMSNGTTKIFEYNGKGYIAFMNNATKNFELYDENFELLLSKSVALDNRVSFTVQDDIIALTTGNLSYGNNSKGVYYSLKTFDEIAPSKLPIEKYMGVHESDWETGKEKYSIAGVTFAETIVDMIPVDLNQFENGRPFRGDRNISKIDGYFYAALDLREEKEFYEDSIGLFKFDLQGNIVESATIIKDDFKSANSAIILNEKIIFPFEQYVEYDLPTLTMTKTYPSPNSYPELGKLSNDLYYFGQGNDLIFANYDGKEKYRVPNLAYVLSHSNSYFVGSANRADSLYSLVTGEKLLEEKDFSLSVFNDRVIAHKGNLIEPDYDEYKATVKLYGEKVNTPVEKTYDTDKPWTITFNKDVNENTVSNETIYVIDDAGIKVDGLSFNTQANKVEVKAPAAGYVSGKTYTLHVTTGVQSLSNVANKKAETRKFTIK